MRLKRVAAEVDRIAREYAAKSDDPSVAAELIQEHLFSYANDLDDWAHEIAAIMLKRAGQHDFDTWMSLGELITKETRKKLRDAMTGARFADLQEAQVDLIKSLPREAAEKAHEIAMKSLSNGDRYTDFVGLIEKLGTIAESRAICIARTETARARTSYTQARAEAVGSTHYIWHCVHDGATRDRHRELDGTIQSWADPPITSEPGQKEIRSAPGSSFNCRCYAEPLFKKSKYED